MDIPKIENNEGSHLLEVDLKCCARIIDRGLYFWKKLTPKNEENLLKNSNSISEWAFYVRSLSEICEGMLLWFNSINNIKALQSASFIDHASYLIKLVKMKQKDGKELNQMEKFILEHAKDKYYAIPYPDGKIDLGDHRYKSEIFCRTSVMVSKLIHQDEYSVIGLETPLREEWIKIFLDQSKFWMKDSQGCCGLVDKNHPQIISYYEANYELIPFNVKEMPW